MSSRARSILAAVVSLGCATYFFATLARGAKAAAILVPISVGAAAAATMMPFLAAQLMARSVWWSNFLLGMLLTALGSHHEARGGVGLLVGCGFALLVADRRALASAADRDGFRPAAYEGTLQLMLVLALADAQTLTLFALLERESFPATAKVYALVACGLVAGFVGLLRLSLWGVTLTMSSAAALAAVIITGHFPQDSIVAPPLLAMATLQLAVPLPMLLSMLLKRRGPEIPARVRALVARGFVVALAVATVAFRLRYRL